MSASPPVPLVVSIVVALDLNCAIGIEGRLPWRIPTDMLHFRTITSHKPVIMGSKTFESIPKALDNGRDMIVVTSKSTTNRTTFTSRGALPVASLQDALGAATYFATLRGAKEICIIGGASLFEEALTSGCATRAYVTVVNTTREGADVHFNGYRSVISAGKDGWKMTNSRPMPRTDSDQFDATFITFDRVNVTAAA